MFTNIYKKNIIQIMTTFNIDQAQIYWS